MNLQTMTDVGEYFSLEDLNIKMILQTMTDGGVGEYFSFEDLAAEDFF